MENQELEEKMSTTYSLSTLAMTIQPLHTTLVPFSTTSISSDTMSHKKPPEQTSKHIDKALANSASNPHHLNTHNPDGFSIEMIKALSLQPHTRITLSYSK